jgi:hypothetical protein
VAKSLSWVLGSVTRKWNNILPNFRKSGQKIAKYFAKAEFKSLKPPNPTNVETFKYPQQTMC